MAQNMISVTFTADEVSALQTTVEQLRKQLQGKTISLDADTRRELYKMGSSENFCRKALGALDANRQVVAPSLGLDEAIKDLQALDVISPLLRDLSQIVERVQDTQMALGSDVMHTSVEGYRLLKHHGRNQGLDGLVDELGARFKARARRGTPAPVEIPVANLG